MRSKERSCSLLTKNGRKIGLGLVCLSVLILVMLWSCSSSETSESLPTMTPNQSETSPRDRVNDQLDTWWSDLSQTERNQCIVESGYDQLGQVTGLQCKEWVRAVVAGASQNIVLLPPTRPNNWQWNTNLHVRLLVQNACPANLCPGHIVQMSLASGLPHTAIVYACGQWGMTWLDANWVNYNNPVGTVATHTITWTQFYRQARNFSFYEIIG